jgi:hypothetical protein
MNILARPNAIADEKAKRLLDRQENEARCLSEYGAVDAFRRTAPVRESQSRGRPTAAGGFEEETCRGLSRNGWNRESDQCSCSQLRVS